MNIEDINDQRAIETHIKTVFEHKPIYSNDKYSIYDNGIVGKKLIGLSTADVMCDLVDKLNIAKTTLEVIINQPCPFDDIDPRVFDSEQKPCDICSIRKNCTGTTVKEALRKINGDDK